jgi:nitrogen fixation protein FixH
MEHQNIALTLGVGVLASFALFILFYKGLKRPGKLASLLTFLVVQAVYVPLAALHWGGLDVFAIHFSFFTMAAVLPGIIVGNRQSGQGDPGRFHWGPGIIIGFFMILVVVDSTIITLANSGASADFVRKFLPAPHRAKVGKEVTSAFSGSVARDFQKNTAQYNQYLAQLQQQNALGWRILDGWIDHPQAGKPTLFRLRVVDNEGKPVTGAQVTVQFLFAADKSQDIQVTLPEVDSGSYGQPVDLPAAGAWLLLINITHGKDVYEAKGETKVAIGR